MKANSVLLLTACVSPSGMAFTALQNMEARKKQYLSAIRFYLNKTDLKIVVVENTEFDFSCYFPDEVQRGRLECLTFKGNNYDKTLGKGYGEGKILHYALCNSSFLKNADYIFKITGRYIYSNIKLLIFLTSHMICNQKIIMCDIKRKEHQALSGIIIAPTNFFKNYLIDELEMCNDTEGLYFEHILYNCIIESQKNYQHLSFPVNPINIGISGTLNMRFNNKGPGFIKRFCKIVLEIIGLYKI